MPSGRVHDMIGLATAPVVTLVGVEVYRALGSSTPLVDALMLGGFYLIGTWFLSPDLDLDSSIYRRWGPLRIIWWPYRKLIKHRSAWSHSGISGALRIIYLQAWFLLITWLLSYTPFGIGLLQDVHLSTSQAFTGIMGVVLADLVHVVADRLPIKRSTRRKRRAGPGDPWDW